MRNTQFLDIFINKLVEKINSFDQQWKGTRFASIDQSALEAQEDDDQIQYEQFLQKYRGKNGQIKPLGLILFHKYLCALITLFLALSLLFVPITIVYSFGEGLSEFKTTSVSKSMLIFSIANLPRYRLDDLTTEELSEISLHRYLTLSTDIIAILVIFWFVLYFKVVVARVTTEYMAKSPTPNLYCLEVENIEGCDEHDILQHFARLGKVSQISYIYTHKDLVFDLRRMVKLVTHLCHLKPDDREYDSIFEQVQKKYKSLAKIYLSMPKPQIKSAFVCFQSINNRNRVHDLYKYRINPNKLDIQLHGQLKLHSEIFSQQNQTETDMRRKQSDGQITSVQSNLMIRPVVKKCKYEPLTINWQNCDIDKKLQAVKFCCQFILLVVVAFVILLGLFLININSSHVKQIGVSVNLAQSSQKNFGNDKEIRERYTFCASLKLSNFKLEYYNLCSDYLQFQRNRFALMLTFALMVSVINLLTNRIMWALVAFRRYRTMAERNAFLMTSIFLFSLVNSAILILCIRGHYTGPILRKIVGTLLNFDEDLLQVTVYSEFNRNWYMNIGAQLMMNYVVSLIMFPNFHILLHWIRSKYRAIKAKRTRKPIKKPVFNYVTFYAISLKSIFFGLMYSNCMPVFYLLCCLALTVEMGVGRLLLSKFVDEPVFVDNSAIDLPINMIPYALLLHCLTSVLFLSVEEIYPTEDSYEKIHASWAQTNLLKAERGYIYVIIFLLISIYIYNRSSVDALVLDYWARKQEGKANDRTKLFREIRNNPAFLTSYKMKDNPKYKILHFALQLFAAHMEKIRENGVIDQSEELNITTMLEQESAQDGVRNRSQLQYTNIVKTLEDEVFDANTLANEELVHSLIWSESDSTSRKQDQVHDNYIIEAQPR